MDKKLHIISESDLIDKNTNIENYDLGGEFWHISRNPLEVNTTTKDQSFLTNYSLSGRPNGLWFSRGSTWLNFTRSLGNPNFPPCCFIYSMTLQKENILFIDTLESFELFDKKYGDYWINWDKFDAEGMVRGKSHNIHRKIGDSILQNLFRSNIIFLTIEQAKENNFYANMTDSDIQRWKQKDWIQIAKDYSGVYFNFPINKNISDKKSFDPLNFRWFASLDAPSGCVWNVNSGCEKFYHKYSKLSLNKWIEI